MNSITKLTMDDDRKKPPMEPSLTYTYKQVENTIINLDVFLPSKRYGARNIPSPIMLFVHGGAWIGGNRQEFSRPVFEEFLSHEFVVVSTDYRLAPESSFVNGQLEDIRDVETWIKTEMPSKLKDHGFDVQTEQVVVVGGSAGALLALLTPKLWKTKPSAILAIYGPTNMHRLPRRTTTTGPLASLKIPCPSPETLKEITNYDCPPSNTPRPTSAAEWLSPRTKMGIYMFRSETVVDLLLHGLTQIEQDGKRLLAFPQAGSATKEEIDQICAQDGLFETCHVTDFAAALEKQGIPHKEHIVPGVDHAFDMGAKVGDDVHLNVIKPAVDWIVQVVGSS
ncbi:alpha/beta-hydrolase [Aureobasidium pullulans]|uniref:Alpha/beta-hydrolase n=1 Tax=Aureobasidium pullulans TaxID=5580 RepID=A0A4S8Z120_AURPU|nr:alpha/beta-hydrolase [Aureobasidium pullulans]